jgi:hypothetical protein
MYRKELPFRVNIDCPKVATIFGTIERQDFFASKCPTYCKKIDNPSDYQTPQQREEWGVCRCEGSQCFLETIGIVWRREQNFKAWSVNIAE